MQEYVYLLKLAEDANLMQGVMQRLCLLEAPFYVRVATLVPISNFGYPEGAEGFLLAWNESGITFGVADNPSIPRCWVPAHNIASVADGDMLKDFSDFQVSNPEASWADFLHLHAGVDTP